MIRRVQLPYADKFCENSLILKTVANWMGPCHLPTHCRGRLMHAGINTSGSLSTTYRDSGKLRHAGYVKKVKNRLRRVIRGQLPVARKGMERRLDGLTVQRKRKNQTVLK